MSTRRIARALILIFVLFSCVSCDQVTKSVAQTELRGELPRTYLDGVVRLEYAENPGAFLSLGANLSESARRWLFVGMAGMILVGLLVFALTAARRMPMSVLVAVVLLVGGGVSNLIDRVLNQGRVVDFMSIGLGPLRTGVFNVADVAIMAGVALIALTSLKGDSHADA